MKKLILTSIGTFVALIGFQQEASAAWYTGTITKIQLAPDGSFVLFLDSAANNECGGKNVRFSNTSAASHKLVFAAALSYEAQGIPVQFSITSCSGTTGVFEYIEST